MGNIGRIAIRKGKKNNVREQQDAKIIGIFVGKGRRLPTLYMPKGN